MIGVSRSSEPRVDLADLASIGILIERLGAVDAVICCATSAPQVALDDENFLASLQHKLFGQVELVRRAAGSLRDGGSITVTSGAIPDATPSSAGGALVIAGLEAFVRSAAPEMPRGIRLNAVSPGWVRESLEALGMDASDGTPVSTVARAYVELLVGTQRGQVVRP